MRKIRNFFLLCMALFISAASLPSHAEVEELPFITVYAASSMTLPLTEAIRVYSALHPVSIAAVYDSSSELAKRIEETGDADLFISASPFWINYVKNQRLLENDSITNLYGNKLAIIAATDSSLFKNLPPKLPLKELVTHIYNRAIMVLGNPDITALGAYSKEALQKLGVWKKMESMIIRTDNARMALYLIAKGRTVGISFFSDAALNKEVEIVAVLPASLHSPIIFQGVVVKGENRIYAHQFMDFLRSPEASAIFTRYGFSSLP